MPHMPHIIFGDNFVSFGNWVNRPLNPKPKVKGLNHA